MAKKKGRKKAGGSRGKAPSVSIASVSVAELEAELGKRQREVSKLLAKRERLVEQIEEIDNEVAGLGGPGIAGFKPGLRKRPKNEMNLVDALATVLDGQTMSVTEVAEAVQQAGYKTTSSSFRTIVNQTLINSNKFKRVSRGKYTAK